MIAVIGPNEAGKSSWFAATYAGLAGRRIGRGRGTAAEFEFRARHKPWSGSRWAAGVTVTLDSGLTLRMEQDLARGECTIVDVSTGREVREHDLEQQESAKRREDAAALTQVLDGRTLDDVQAELATSMAEAAPEPADPMPPDLNAFRADAVADHEAAVNTDGQLRGRIQALSNELGSVAEAVEKEADAERSARRVETLKECLDEAIAELGRARAQVYASIAPALQDRMRPWLPRVTNGRYLDVSVEPNDLTMQVTEAGGQKRQADRLSHGTTEQIYLLLRVALSEVLSGGAETAPLILDDVTTQSDSDRTVAVMELLGELSKEHQVIIFTQEDDVVAWAEQHCDPERDALIALPAPGV